MGRPGGATHHYAARRKAAQKRAADHQRAVQAGGPGVGMRKCLGCDHDFLSEGPWNRICPKCSQRHGDPALPARPPCKVLVPKKGACPEES